MTRSAALIPDGHFLSATNPTATVDQRDLEALALEVFAMPQVQRSRQIAAMRWKTCIGTLFPADAWTSFQPFLDECCFQYVLKAVNSDANYPKVLGHVAGPAHQWFGNKVPGSRAGGGDCPDNNYVIVPIDPYARFELQCQSFAPGLADCPFVITGDITLASTINVLDWQDVKMDEDGSFVVSIGPNPANGRSNHLQTKLEARYLFIREVRSNWRQPCNAYRVRRLDPPTAAPLTKGQMADRAALFIVADVPALYFFNRVMDAISPNTCTPVFNTGTIGGLVTQMQSMGRIVLAQDEAFVITIGHGDARYRSAVLIDPNWLHSLSAWDRPTSRNISQTTPNNDDSTTYVVSAFDPGFPNWLDTVGASKVGIMFRWQGLPRDLPDTKKPWLKTQLVKCDDLKAILPKEARWMSTEARQQEYVERAAALSTRYQDRS